MESLEQKRESLLRHLEWLHGRFSVIEKQVQEAHDEWATVRQAIIATTRELAEVVKIQCGR